MTPAFHQLREVWGHDIDKLNALLAGFRAEAEARARLVSIIAARSCALANARENVRNVPACNPHPEKTEASLPHMPRFKAPATSPSVSNFRGVAPSLSVSALSVPERPGGRIVWDGRRVNSKVGTSWGGHQGRYNSYQVWELATDFVDETKAWSSAFERSASLFEARHRGVFARTRMPIGLHLDKHPWPPQVKTPLFNLYRNDGAHWQWAREQKGDKPLRQLFRVKSQCGMCGSRESLLPDQLHEKLRPEADDYLEAQWLAYGQTLKGKHICGDCWDALSGFFSELDKDTLHPLLKWTASEGQIARILEDLERRIPGLFVGQVCPKEYVKRGDCHCTYNTGCKILKSGAE